MGGKPSLNMMSSIKIVEVNLFAPLIRTVCSLGCLGSVRCVVLVCEVF